MKIRSQLSFSSSRELFEKASSGTIEDTIAEILSDWKKTGFTSVHFVYFANIWKQNLLVNNISEDVDIPEVSVTDLLQSSVVSGSQSNELSISKKNSAYFNELLKANFLLPDGIAFRLLHYAYFHPELSRGKILMRFPYYSGMAIPNKNGTDFVPKFLNYTSARIKGLRVILYGSRSEYSQKIVEKVQSFGIVDVRYSDGYEAFNFKFLEKGVPCILLVGLGSPKQEEWVAKYRETLFLHADNLLIFTVGGLFDFWSGVEKRSPVFFRKLHLEWLWRALSQPKKNLRKTLVSFYFFWVLLFVR